MGFSPVIRQRFYDANGDPLSGGKLYTYQAGTTTPKATYSDPDCETPNSNPVELDANGYADVWIASGAYKFRLDDADDVTLWTKDDIRAIESAGDEDDDVGEAWLTYDITDGQSATELDGQTIDSANYSGAIYEYEIIRGTTVHSTGKFSFHYRDGAWKYVPWGENRDDDSAAHGVTISFTGTTTAQLTAAASSGPGDGTLKIKRSLISAA